MVPLGEDPTVAPGEGPEVEVDALLGEPEGLGRDPDLGLNGEAPSKARVEAEAPGDDPSPPVRPDEGRPTVRLRARAGR